MIQEIHSFEEYMDFINEISVDKRYSDPHFACDKNNLFNAFSEKTQKSFVSRISGKTEGLFVWQILPDDKYIEMIIGFTANKDAFSDMLDFIMAQYQGYQIDFVVNPNNDVICGRLKAVGAVFDCEQQKMVHKHDIKIGSALQIERLSEKWEKQYCSLHDEDTYWTAERVLGAKDKFRTFVAIADQQLIGYLDVTYCYEENEPYALYVKKEYANQGYEIALLEKALLDNKPKQMMVLVDVDAKEEINIYSSVGFEVVEGQNSIYASFHS